MRRAMGLIGILALVPLGLAAGEKQPKQEYVEFSRLVHRIVVSQMPKEFVDDSGWGQTIPAPEKLPFPLLRKYVKVGDKLEVPHGTWRRFKGKIEHPDKQLRITVKDFKQLEDKATYRLVADVDAAIMCQGDWQQWQKGLLLINVETIADARLTAAIVCDVGVSLDLAKFPPELKIEPKVNQLGLDLVDFKLRNGPNLQGEQADQLRKDLKELLRGVLKASELVIKDQVNQAITQSLKEGKGTISAGAIMKTLPPSKK